MGIILLKMPQWLISVFNWFTLSSMKKIIITQMLIAIIITMFDKTLCLGYTRCCGIHYIRYRINN